MTITQYFKEAYNKTLEFGKLPCIIFSKKYFLPLEVCVVLPGLFLNKLFKINPLFVLYLLHNIIF